MTRPTPAPAFTPTWTPDAFIPGLQVPAPAPVRVAPKFVVQPRPTPTPEQRLNAARGHVRSGRVHGCFDYAWALVNRAGGDTLGGAKAVSTGRGRGTAYLATLVADGNLRTGDVIYANRRPGKDPTSTNLAYGPHWFVYMGNGQFADQYGVKGNVQEMENFIPGRKIDTIYRTMG